MNHWPTVQRIAWGVVIIMVTIALISAFVPKIRRYQESYVKREEFRDENRRLAEEVKKLRDKQERFTSDPLFVERTAREIGMVKPDEIVFKYTNDEVKADKVIQ